MMDSNERMVREQALRISTLNRQLYEVKEKANELMEKLEKCQSQAAMYSQIEKLVGVHSNLADNWSDFLMMLKLVEPNVEEQFKELMVPQYVRYVLNKDKPALP